MLLQQSAFEAMLYSCLAIAATTPLICYCGAHNRSGTTSIALNILENIKNTSTFLPAIAPRRAGQHEEHGGLQPRGRAADRPDPPGRRPDLLQLRGLAHRAALHRGRAVVRSGPEGAWKIRKYFERAFVRTLLTG